jgi:hypothetical protein
MFNKFPSPSFPLPPPHYTHKLRPAYKFVTFIKSFGFSFLNFAPRPRHFYLFIPDFSLGGVVGRKHEWQKSATKALSFSRVLTFGSVINYQTYREKE